MVDKKVRAYASAIDKSFSVVVFFANPLLKKRIELEMEVGLMNGKESDLFNELVARTAIINLAQASIRIDYEIIG